MTRLLVLCHAHKQNMEVFFLKQKCTAAVAEPNALL